MDAVLRSDRDDKGDRIILLLHHAYILHNKYGTKGYGDSILTTLLQFDYLRVIDHPVLRTFHADPNIAIEEHGEITLSQLAAAMLNAPDKMSYEALERTYKLIGMRGSLSRNTMHELGMPTSNHFHVNSNTHHADNVDALATHLRSLARRTIKTKKLSIYEVGHRNGIAVDKVESYALLSSVATIDLLYQDGDIPNIRVHCADLLVRYGYNVAHPELVPLLKDLAGGRRTYLGR